MTENKKRKIESKGRVFNSEWTYKYLFRPTVANSKILCLVCRKVVSVSKEYNLRRHFETNHPKLAALDAHEKSLKQRVYAPIFALSKTFLSFRAMKVLLLSGLASKFQEKLLLRERVLLRESL